MVNHWPASQPSSLTSNGAILSGCSSCLKRNDGRRKVWRKVAAALNVAVYTCRSGDVESAIKHVTKSWELQPADFNTRRVEAITSDPHQQHHQQGLKQSRELAQVEFIVASAPPRSVLRFRVETLSLRMFSVPAGKRQQPGRRHRPSHIPHIHP